MYIHEELCIYECISVHTMLCYDVVLCVLRVCFDTLMLCRRGVGQLMNRYIIIYS
jgi:hypothetical protein